MASPACKKVESAWQQGFIGARGQGGKGKFPLPPSLLTMLPVMGRSTGEIDLLVAIRPHREPPHHQSWEQKEGHDVRA